ncbi:hypothetical protein CMI47_04495 [Candidatus Pacearchaeota archaeon]|jgi:quercetin dioxygenase-like cupin family protein|nr:hypothetical protein [Candidatus Pacearchaeota archaeon]|tara:strand:+ start:139 stop:546 length:408 start_codon:yes stop_codon:yes gene_type:complete
MQALEQSIIDELELVEFETEHIFAKGTYTRVLHVPAGHVLTGHIHRESCINIVVKGKMKAATSEGDKLVQAGDYLVSGPGEKKAGYAIEDTTWINVFPNPDDTEDVPKLLDRLCYMEGYEQLERETHAQLDFFED